MGKNFYVKGTGIAGKDGYVPREGVERVNDLYPTFKSMSGSITQGKAGKDGLSETAVMHGVAMKESSMRNTSRGYLYNFDDTAAQKEYKDSAMRRGSNIAGVHAMKQEAESVAVPRLLNEYNSPIIKKAIADKVKNDSTKNRDIGAAFTVMQDKMSKSRTLDEGLRAWRGKNSEPEYPKHVKVLATKIRESF